MTYAAEQDMINNFGQDRLIELTDRGNTGAIDLTVLTQALDAADAEIDPYLVGLYSLPLANVPTVLVNFACDIAMFRLYTQIAPDQVNARYKNAIAFLTNVAAGKISLGIDSANLPVSDGGNIGYSASPREFNATNLSDY